MLNNIISGPRVAFYAEAKDAHVEHCGTPVIALVYGESGYRPIYTSLTPADLNANVTPEEVRSAVWGSMFGWDVPGAKLAADKAKALLAALVPA